MSGATGLSAAIRRRASNAKQEQENILPKKCSDVRNINNNTKINKVSSNPSVNDVLGFHEVRINTMDEGLNSLNEQQQTLDENMNILLEKNENEFKKIGSEINDLKIKKSHIDSVESKESPEDIAYFKEKVLLLESQILELKNLVLKVQNQVMTKTLSI